MPVDAPNNDCEHIRIFSNLISPNPAEYYWKCAKCGRHGVDIVGSSIITEASDLQFRKLKKRFGGKYIPRMNS